MSQYVKQENLSPELSTKIRNYLSYIYQKENHRQRKDQEAVLSKLSRNVQNEIKEQVQGKHFKNMKVLHIFSKQTQKKLIFSMQKCRYLPGDVLSDF